jgi:hypothetical protein
MSDLIIGNINLILVVSVLVFCFVIVLIIYRDFKEKKLMIDENRKLEKKQFYQQYPQFFIRENWEIIDRGCFKFIPTNDTFQFLYIKYSNGNILKDSFNTPEGFKDIFVNSEVGFIENYLWGILMNDISDKKQEAIRKAKEKYQT